MAARGWGKKYQGMNWIRKEKRLAIYLRDGLACCYCGATVEDGARLTLDHIVPHSHGGSNNESNLVTACQKCNSSRGDRAVSDFCDSVAIYLNHGIQGKEILAHIEETRARKLDVPAAKELIARRGGFVNACKK